MMTRQTTADLDGDLPAPAAAKTMAAIEAVGRKAYRLTQAEVVKATDCSANLVFRMLSTLESLGYMTRREESRRYVLPGRLLESCQPRAMGKSLVLCAHPAMEWLRDRSRETVQLMLRTGNRGMVLAQVSGLKPVQVMGQIGMLVPLYSCAPGKAILAALPEAELDEWLAATTLKSFTEKTKVSRAELLTDLQQSRRRGYTEDWEDGIEGIRCIAAPILDACDRPVGAITAMSPVIRLPRKRFTELGQWCIEAAARVRKELLS
ncbi:MAG: IclR family transcriptional regulator [Rubripirellula sp.]